MSERVLTLAQVYEEKILPLSRSRLYEIAQEGGGSPFHKRGGRWMTVESDLLAWVRAGEKPSSRRSAGGDPMPRPRQGHRGALIERVREIRSEVA